MKCLCTIKLLKHSYVNQAIEEEQWKSNGGAGRRRVQEVQQISAIKCI